ncbi:hypothetical protein H312_02764 [Anncaliia algerae PRA339]|uniref:Transcription initiation factor TFIID subunit 8 n=1 Tax=Anncaliia algerae PRA339 TaxID=1288291 RepID=A0A059EYP4_9MICR|nr:hypothetical protein H312_02764 [Anncaliia algerae PRA339]
MAYMHELIKYCIVKVLKETGYECFEEKAIYHFIEVFELYMQKILVGIKNNSTHCGRNRTTLIDFITKFELKDVKSYDLVNYEYPQEEKVADFVGPISTPVEKFMYIYEFMPPFPPLHTFKETIIKERKVRSRARDVKDKIEQRNRIIESLFTLSKLSKKKFKFANYLNKN